MVVPWIMSVCLFWNGHTQEYDYYLPRLRNTPVGTAALTICNEHCLPFYVMTTPLMPPLLFQGYWVTGHLHHYSALQVGCEFVNANR